ncbi:MAG: hypothetical protein R3F61_17105 [Myxococcota bacterium]
MRPHWSQVEATLDRYEEPAVREVVVRVLRAELADDPAARGPVAHELSKALSAHFGAWYAQGPTVGDETVSPWCWCHSFWKPWAAEGSRESRIQAVADGVIEQIELCRSWRLQLARWFWDREKAGLDERLESDLLDLVAVLVDLGLHDAWYVHVEAAVAWYLEALGHTVPADLPDVLEGIAGTSFTSWVDPTPADRKRFAEAAAWAVFERMFDAANPPS